MFQHAIKIAQQFTWPVVICGRHEDGTTASLIGSFIILNRDGWILTAAHIVDGMQKWQKEVSSYEIAVKEIDIIRSDHNLTHNQKRKKIRNVKKTKNSITNTSSWWGNDVWSIRDGMANRFYDLASGKIENFDDSLVANYPIFKNLGSGFDVGMMLCKLGFAFAKITPIFQEANNSFLLPPGTVPLPIFPIEGIFTRTIIVNNDNPPISAKFLETSSAGLPGQSGGPIFDPNGHVWAMQVRTDHHPLDFGGKQHQYFHAGLGTHVESIMAYLREVGIEVQLEGK